MLRPLSSRHLDPDLPFPNFCRTTLKFGLFVEKCVMHCISLSSTSDELDTLLRRAACLDPNAFGAVLARCEGMTRILWAL